MGWIHAPEYVKDLPGLIVSRVAFNNAIYRSNHANTYSAGARL